jgi:coenzyme F420-reducing hydrogenase alpha subunit
MSHKEHIDIDYLARVEGETAIRIELKKGAPIELKIFEPPRFFEGMLVGRRYDEVGDIVSRICGICPVSHMTTAILAIEKAMGIEVSPQTKTMRDVMTLSQIVASHLIHLYMLAMPDYYGCSGVVDMLPQFKGEIDRLLKMKEVMNGLTSLIGGRALHAVTHMPGGFTCMPDDADCRAAVDKLKEILPDAEKVVEVVAQFQTPDFHPHSEYVALQKKGEYAFNDGRIVSTGGLDIPAEEYERHFKESQVPYAMAKQSVIRGRGPFMVGSLARTNLKFYEFQEETKTLARKVGFSSPSDNPYYNNLAQALEAYDGVLRCIQLLESHSFKDEKRQVKIKAGEGEAVTEAPRGLLYHWYRIDGKGIVEKANLVTPTSHNFLNIEKDLKQLVDENVHKGRDELRLLCEQLLRAYDPCFSCSVH